MARTKQTARKSLEGKLPRKSHAVSKAYDVKHSVRQEPQEVKNDTDVSIDIESLWKRIKLCEKSIADVITNINESKKILKNLEKQPSKTENIVSVSPTLSKTMISKMNKASILETLKTKHNFTAPPKMLLPELKTKLIEFQDI